MAITQEMPLVSVIMPAYNAARFIEEAIQSVQAQTITNWELLVIDDGSKDESLRIAQQLAKDDIRISAISNAENMGVAKTRNRGIDMARGQYIAFLDSDDVWHPEKLARQIAVMQEKSADIGYCSYRIIGESGEQARADYLVPETARFEDILKENYIQCSAMLIRTEVLRKIHFNTEYYHEDYILGLDILRAGYCAAGCNETLLSWRYLENSRSFNKKKSAKNRWRIYRNYLRFPLLKCACLFSYYTIAGLRKYLRKK